MRLEKEVRGLEAAVARMADIVHWPEERLSLPAPGVSAWSAVQHLQHLVLATSQMLRAIEILERDEDERILRRGRPSFLGTLVLWTGWILRGRGQAPPGTRADLKPRRSEVREGVAGLAEQVAALGPRAPGLAPLPGRLPHPALGAFRARHWLRFARVHADHHLAIVDDIDRQLRSSVPAADVLPASETP